VFAAGKNPQVVVADKHYGGIEAVEYYGDQNVQTCDLRRLTDGYPGRLLDTESSRLEQDKTLGCPAGRYTTRRIKRGYRM
jgi:hypothetical protein